MISQLNEQEDSLQIPAPEPTLEPGYTQQRYVYLGLRIPVTIRDQIGTPMTILFDTKEQVINFIYGFPLVLQRGQVVRFECDFMGLHGWLHGKSPEARDSGGRRIMPTHGDPVFDSLVSSLQISPNLSEEMEAWERYTSHNPEWYLLKSQQRYAENRERESQP